MAYYSEVEGDEDDMATEGEDVLGDLMGAAGTAPRRPLLRARQGILRLPARPGWRHGQVAPGVVGPYQGLEPLPLTPLNGTGAFTAAGPATIEFRGQPQRPFRGERLLAEQINTPTAALVFPTARAVANAIFVGTKLQTTDVGNLSLTFFTAQAFGVRLAMMPAAPGMLIRVIVSLAGPALVAEQEVLIILTILGRSVS